MIAEPNGDKANATAAEIARETGRKCLGTACDGSRADMSNAVVAATIEAVGDVSTLVDNVRRVGRHDNVRPFG